MADQWGYIFKSSLNFPMPESLIFQTTLGSWKQGLAHHGSVNAVSPEPGILWGVYVFTEFTPHVIRMCGARVCSPKGAWHWGLIPTLYIIWIWGLLGTYVAYIHSPCLSPFLIHDFSLLFQSALKYLCYVRLLELFWKHSSSKQEWQ